jgi:predicted transposase YbfD/YdcC
MAMAHGIRRAVQAHFSCVKDPRVNRTKRHDLLDVITMSLCGVLAGANGWAAIAEFAKSKREWLETFLSLPNGTPSADTFRRVLSRLNPKEFFECCIQWLESLSAACPVDAEKQVAIDGKTARRSFDRAKEQSALHLVSAWSAERRLILGQEAVHEKSNEITAIPRLLQMIDISEAIVTIDAMGCQTEIAGQIRDGGGDYVLALKGNQEKIHERVQDYFDHMEEHMQAGVKFSYHETSDRAHGRQEKRMFFTCPADVSIDPDNRWRDLRSIGMVITERTVADKTTVERRYYLNSIRSGAKRFGRAVRGHWSIENSLHWTLDLSFREDESRIRKDHGQEILGALRRIALSRLKNDKSVKRGVEIKRQKAGWDHGYLLHLLLAAETT